MAYRRTAKVETRLADNRARILGAARTLVADGGFRGAQVAAVAAAAGLATGSVYRYFPSKAHLMVELLRAICAREAEVARAIAAGGGPARERLGGAIRAFVERALRGDRLAYAVIAEPAAQEIEDARQEIKRELALIFGGLIGEAATEGSVPIQEPDLAGACIVGAMLEGLTGPLAHLREAADDEAVAAGIVAFCLRAVGPGGQDRNAGRGTPHVHAIR
ncbi:MAG TPA: TetR/AcrR family transcriptional regulator [Alphaproteobacteria bacterium]|nr:TetR/AcrR family transcriptional regulator [Alphaproteobacteria bacterium]